MTVEPISDEDLAFLRRWFSDRWRSALVRQTDWSALLARLDAAEADRDLLRAILCRHHEWHTVVEDVWLIRSPDGDLVKPDDAVEYAESELCRDTIEALSATPPGAAR